MMTTADMDRVAGRPGRFDLWRCERCTARPRCPKCVHNAGVLEELKTANIHRRLQTVIFVTVAIVGTLGGIVLGLWLGGAV